MLNMPHDEIKKFVKNNAFNSNNKMNPTFGRRYPEIKKHILEYTSFLDQNFITYAHRVFMFLNDIHKDNYNNIVVEVYLEEKDIRKTINKLKVQGDFIPPLLRYFNVYERKENLNEMELTYNRKEIKKIFNDIPNFYKSNGSINGSIWKNKKTLIKNIENLTKYLNDDVKINERVYHIINDLYNYPQCECGNKITLFYNTKDGYGKFCSITCSAKSKYNAKIHTGHTMSQAAKEKSKQTCLEKYGVDNYFKVPEFIKNNYSKELISLRDINRCKSINEKYGVNNVFQLKDVKEKIKKRNIEKYGVYNYSQKHLSEQQLQSLNNKEYLKNLNEIYSIGYIAKLVGVDSTTILSYFEKLNIERNYFNETICETSIKNILDKYNIQYIQNERSILNGKEIDFYLPQYKLGIECNGLYWHSEIKRPDVNYHQNKFEKCKESGVFLYQFWETEISEKIDIIESMIKNKVNLNEKIYARKCIIKPITNIEASIFITDNHLQSIKPQAIHKSFGMYYNNKLVSVIAFNVAKEITINRFCTLKGYNVIGGFSKFIKYTKQFFNNETFYTFSDCRYSDGGLYKNSGFEKISKNSSIDYFYCYDFTKIIHKRELRKQNIKLKHPEYYDDNKTERQMAKEIGYTRINSCKIIKWKL